MKNYGKEKCRILKEIRAEIARQNDIEWVVSECKHKGDCQGTCPKCEQEVLELEEALANREVLGVETMVLNTASDVDLTVKVQNNSLFRPSSERTMGYVVCPENKKGTGSIGMVDFEENKDGTYTVKGKNRGCYGKLKIPSRGGLVTAIGDGGFGACYDLTAVIIPDSVTKIGFGAFFRCSSLTSITIPDGVTTIGARAFGECGSLTAIVIPGSVIAIGNKAFEGCSKARIYCAHPSKPDTWADDWNPDDCPVVWNFTTKA